jgi:hypothetical protein
VSENLPPEEKLADEFKNLGKNLADLLQAAWDNPERKRVQQELENGFSDLGSTLKSEAESWAESPTGQRLKTDLEELSERIRNAETREKVRVEVLGILRNVNDELQKVIDKWAVPQAEKAAAGTAAEDQATGADQAEADNAEEVG